MKIQERRVAYRESLREDILDAARQLFAVNGYEATSMRAIAQKVNCSPGILYHYFEDKQDIMALLVRETFAKLRARLEAIRLDQDSVEARMKRGLRAYIEFGLEYPHHYSLLFMRTVGDAGNERIFDVFQQVGMQTFNNLRFISAEAIEAGILHPELTDSEELAQSLWAAVHGLVSIKVTCEGFPWIERSRLCDRLLDILMRGILK